MKNTVILMLLCALLSSCASTKRHSEKNYAGRYALFSEDVEKFLGDSDAAGDLSQIIIHNDTPDPVTFEFRELRTKFWTVTSDKVKPIRGRANKITLNPDEYINTNVTLSGIEHMLFVFDERDKYVVSAYTLVDYSGMATSVMGFSYNGSGGTWSTTTGNFPLIYDIRLK